MYIGNTLWIKTAAHVFTAECRLTLHYSLSYPLHYNGAVCNSPMELCLELPKKKNASTGKKAV